MALRIAFAFCLLVLALMFWAFATFVVVEQGPEPPDGAVSDRAVVGFGQAIPVGMFSAPRHAHECATATTARLSERRGEIPGEGGAR